MSMKLKLGFYSSSFLFLNEVYRCLTLKHWNVKREKRSLFKLNYRIGYNDIRMISREQQTGTRYVIDLSLEMHEYLFSGSNKYYIAFG